MLEMLLETPLFRIVFVLMILAFVYVINLAD